MKKLIKMFKDLLNGLIKNQVKVLQSEAFENQLANSIASKDTGCAWFWRSTTKNGSKDGN